MTNMDMLLWTVLIKYRLQAHQHTIEVIPSVGRTDPHQGIIATTGIPTMIIETGTGPVIPDLAHTFLDTGVTATMTPTGVTLDHFIDLHVIAPHATEAQVHTVTAVTHHITDLHPVEIFPKMTADFDHTNLTDNITNQHEDLSQFCKIMPWKNKDRRHKQVTIDNPSSEYYSSDDQDRDCEDDLN